MRSHTHLGQCVRLTVWKKVSKNKHHIRSGPLTPEQRPGRASSKSASKPQGGPRSIGDTTYESQASPTFLPGHIPRPSCMLEGQRAANKGTTLRRSQFSWAQGSPNKSGHEAGAERGSAVRTRPTTGCPGTALPCPQPARPLLTHHLGARTLAAGVSTEGPQEKGDPHLPICMSSKLHHNHQPKVERTGKEASIPLLVIRSTLRPCSGGLGAAAEHCLERSLGSRTEEELGVRGHVPLLSRCPSSAGGPSPHWHLSSIITGTNGSSPSPWATNDTDARHYLTVWGC